MNTLYREKSNPGRFAEEKEWNHQLSTKGRMLNRGFKMHFAADVGGDRDFLHLSTAARTLVEVPEPGNPDSGEDSPVSCSDWLFVRYWFVVRHFVFLSGFLFCLSLPFKLEFRGFFRCTEWVFFFLLFLDLRWVLWLNRAEHKNSRIFCNWDWVMDKVPFDLYFQCVSLEFLGIPRFSGWFTRGFACVIDESKFLLIGFYSEIYCAGTEFRELWFKLFLRTTWGQVSHEEFH